MRAGNPATHLLGSARKCISSGITLIIMIRPTSRSLKNSVILELASAGRSGFQSRSIVLTLTVRIGSILDAKLYATREAWANTISVEFDWFDPSVDSEVSVKAMPIPIPARLDIVFDG